MRHGYKGAFEMAATVDYLFAFAATTRQVAEHHFAALYEAYIEDDRVRTFLSDANDAAYADMLARFEEAIERGKAFMPVSTTTDRAQAPVNTVGEERRGGRRGGGGGRRGGGGGGGGRRGAPEQGAPAAAAESAPKAAPPADAAPAAPAPETPPAGDGASS